MENCVPELTDAAVKRYKPGPTRREIPDSKATGLYLVVQCHTLAGSVRRHRHARGDGPWETTFCSIPPLAVFRIGQRC